MSTESGTECVRDDILTPVSFSPFSITETKANNERLVTFQSVEVPVLQISVLKRETLLFPLAPFLVVKVDVRSLQENS